MHDTWNYEWNDDFYIDGSQFSAEDLDYADIEFLGGALDGNAVRLGIGIVPTELTAIFENVGLTRRETHRYILCDTAGDPRYRLAAMQ